MHEGTVTVIITVFLENGDPDEMIETLTKMGYEPRQYMTGDIVRFYSVTLFKDDLIFLKLLSIPGTDIYIKR